MASPRSPSRTPLRAPSQPPSQPRARRRHLTAEERAAIARERAQGVPVQELARRWGVTRQTIHTTLRRVSESTSAGTSEGGQGEVRDGARAGAPSGPAPLARRSPTLSVRARTEEIEALDAAAARWGLSRPQVMRRLVRDAGALLAPDRAGAAHLAALAAEVREVGVRLNRTAKACNEAQWRRQPIPYTVADHAQTWQAIELVFDTVRQVQAWALAHRAQLDVAVEAALGGGGGDRGDMNGGGGADDRTPQNGS